MKLTYRFAPSLLLVPVLAVVGCSRQDQPGAATSTFQQPLTSPAPAATAASPLAPVPATPAPVQQPLTPSGAQQLDPANEPVETAAAPVRTRRRVVAEDDTPRYVTKQRSKKKSAVIVGGSAATGAAIGALAGGGKGAAIGALVGGAGGFIYDRKTAKKRERVD